jgi:hypothetical protein
MSAALLLFALGTPCLPEELGHLEPADSAPPATVVTAPVAAAAPAPAPKASLPAAPRSDVVAPVAPVAGDATKGSQESSLYRVGYGMLGQLGQIQIAFTTLGNRVRAQGLGTGTMFGLGNYEKRIESHLDSRGRTASRWISYRLQGGKTVIDTVAQGRPGTLAVHRQRTGRPDEKHQLARQQTVMDPLTFLYNLRVDPPRAPRAFEVLDGRALWQIAVEPAVAGTLDRRRPALVVRGRATPIDWDGKPDDERTARSFTIWLDNDSGRTPLRLVMPLAVGEVRVELTGTIVRPTGATAARAAGAGESSGRTTRLVRSR